MQANKTILLPTDFSEVAFNALRNAILFADGQPEAYSIHLLHVLLPESDVMEFPSLNSDNLQARLEISETALTTFTETVLAQIQVSHNLQKPPVIYQSVEVGLPATTISHKAKDGDFDLIVIGTHGKHSRMEKILGSTTTAVIRKATCPVLVIPEKFHLDNLSNAVYASDFAKTDMFHIWQISRFLKPFQPTLRIVHVRDTSKGTAPEKSPELEEFIKSKELGLQVNMHQVEAKDVVEGLSQFIEEVEAQLIILHRMQRSFPDNLFHASVTRKAALQSNVPVWVFPTA